MATRHPQSHTLAISKDEFQQRLVTSVLIVLALVSCVYVYFIGTTIFNVIARKSAENQVKTLSSKVGELELEYLSLNNSLDLAKASSLGFSEPQGKSIEFASRESYVSTAVARGNEL